MKKKRTYRLDNVEVVSTLRSVERALENSSFTGTINPSIKKTFEKSVNQYKIAFPNGLRKSDPIVCNYKPAHSNSDTPYTLYGNIVGFEIDLNVSKLILLVRPKIKSRKELGSALLDDRTDILHFQFEDINFDLT